MLLNFAAVLAFISSTTAAAAVAAPVAAAAPEGASPNLAQANCGWTGYGQTYFRNSYGTTYGNNGVCYSMPGSAWVTSLYSAKVVLGSAVCLYTGGTCNGGHQVIDTAGYRDMTNLPAYNSWRCGAC